MQIKHCEFPDDLFYDVDNDVWLKQSKEETLVGVTRILSALAGKIKTIRLKRDLHRVQRGQLIGTVESGKFFGPIRSPVDGEMIELNLLVEKEPGLVNDFPYLEGWIARMKSSRGSLSSMPRDLLYGNEAASRLEARITELRLRCFKRVPDDELIEVGTECATTLVNLGELMKNKPAGSVVHLVSDDPVAAIELGRWAELTKNAIIESRDEDNLHHFLIEKKAGGEKKSGGNP